MFELWDFQEEAIEEGKKVIEFGIKKKSLIVLPCGAGKSLVIAQLSKLYKEKYGKDVLVLQPSKELLKQNYEKYISFGGEASIFSSSMESWDMGVVTYATPGSLRNKIEELKSRNIGLILIDEAHYQTKVKGGIDKIIKEVKPQAVLGLTATPINMHATATQTVLKMMNRFYKSLFNDICHVTQTKHMVDKGYWSPVSIESKDINSERLELNSSGTDFKLESMLEFYKENALEDKILDEFKKGLKNGRKFCLIFVPDTDIANALEARDNRIKAVTYKTPNKKREKILEDFKKGVIKGVVTIDALGTGYDFPELDFGIMARPTASYSIYYQQYGRFVRRHKDKKDALIIDLSGNTKKFGRPEEMTIEDYGTFGWGMFLGDNVMTDVDVRSLMKIKREHLKDREVKGFKLWFGKHKGQNINNIPTEYLSWLLSLDDFVWDKDEKEAERKKAEVYWTIKNSKPVYRRKKKNWGGNKTKESKENVLW